VSINSRRMKVNILITPPYYGKVKIYKFGETTIFSNISHLFKNECSRYGGFG
jgi:hypothetical protein